MTGHHSPPRPVLNSCPFLSNKLPYTIMAHWHTANVAERHIVTQHRWQRHTAVSQRTCYYRVLYSVQCTLSSLLQENTLIWYIRKLDTKKIDVTFTVLCYFSYNNRTRTEINLNTVYDAMYRHIAISRKNGCKKSKVEMKKCAPCHTCYNSNLF